MTKLLSTISTFIPCCIGEFTQADRDLVIKVSKALGNEARYEIYSFLRENDSCMTSELVEYLPLAQSTISQHLKVLKDSGIVMGVVDGPATNYCIDKSMMKRYHQLIGKMI